FMQFDTIYMRARVETMEIVVKIYQARVIHQYGLCSFHEHNVKEKHIAEIEKQKGKIRKLARSLQILQSQHFDQHADKTKEKRDAIASTYIPHSSSTTGSAKHEEEELNNFEQSMESAPRFSALVSETGMPCTFSSSSSTTLSPKDKRKKLKAFKIFLESTTHYSSLKLNHSNRSRHAIRREQKLLHEGFKLQNMLAYEDDLAHDFFNAVRLRDRARQRLRDLKTMANFMMEQCVARFKYLKLYEKIVKDLENMGEKGKHVENDGGERDETVKRGTELDQLVASFDWQNMRMLMDFWMETLDLGKTDKKALIWLVAFENVRWKFSPPGEAEIPFEARVARLREILEMVRSEGRGGAGVQWTGDSMGLKFLAEGVGRCGEDWRRELEGKAKELLNADGDDELEEVEEEKEEEGEGEETEIEEEEEEGEEGEQEETETVARKEKGKGKENEHPKIDRPEGRGKENGKPKA
ncbi:MAG: hypothetical protein L6R42_010762, partial [Xanthoria sp. 1 TBL-2021]